MASPGHSGLTVPGPPASCQPHPSLAYQCDPLLVFLMFHGFLISAIPLREMCSLPIGAADSCSWLTSQMPLSPAGLRSGSILIELLQLAELCLFLLSTHNSSLLPHNLPSSWTWLAQIGGRPCLSHCWVSNTYRGVQFLYSLVLIDMQ